MLNRRKNTSSVSNANARGKLSRPFILTGSSTKSNKQTSMSEKEPGWRPGDNLNAEERRLHLRKVLNRCTEKLSQLTPKPHIFQTGEYCGVIRGKFYGARGVVRDVDFIHDRVLVDLKSYREPVWMDPGEIELE